MREKLSFQIKTRFSESDMDWLNSEAEKLGIEVSNIVRFAVRKMQTEGEDIHIKPFKKENITNAQKTTYSQKFKIS